MRTCEAESSNTGLHAKKKALAEARALIAMKTGQRAVLMFGFEKKDLANIKPDKLTGYRKAARIYLGYNEEEIMAIVKEKALFEIAPSRKGVDHGKNIQERSIRGVTRKHVWPPSGRRYRQQNYA
jgi:hypothetical protein